LKGRLFFDYKEALVAIQKAGLYDEIGQENICHNIDASLERALRLLVEGAAVRGV